jgi:catechol 2,3-dioxygenase-like lactoylglutathione lyase family enzyme
MSAVRINHVSVHASDLAASVDFYAGLLGLEPIPTPNFGIPVQWLAVGDTQLHVFERDHPPPSQHHFAVTVAELEPVYRRASELGALDRAAFGHHLYELPGDVAQLYVRDPAGNLVEVDAPGASGLPPDIRAEMRALADVYPQSDEHMRARLFVGGVAR